MKKTYDYKRFVYLKVPKERYEEIIKNREKVTYNEIEDWMRNYKSVMYDKKAAAYKANIEKQKRTLDAIINTLMRIKMDLFATDKKNLTAYKLAKLAKVNYLTAKKYFTEEIKKEWERDPEEAILSLKIMRDHI